MQKGYALAPLRATGRSDQPRLQRRGATVDSRSVCPPASSASSLVKVKIVLEIERVSATIDARESEEVSDFCACGGNIEWIYTAKSDGRFGRFEVGETIDLSSYVPSEDEEFMNVKQRAYFRAKLNAWRNDILREARETLDHLAEESANHADIADRASSETDRSIELRARDRQRKLISKIDAALQRIDEGTYGYCEETGEPISLKRLDARPIATLSIEAQERHERREKVYRDE
jgi:DnaK suppressor protein